MKSHILSPFSWVFGSPVVAGEIPHVWRRPHGWHGQVAVGWMIVIHPILTANLYNLFIELELQWNTMFMNYHYKYIYIILVIPFYDEAIWICSIKTHRICHEWIDDNPLIIPSSQRRREHDEHGPLTSNGESSSSPQFMATITWYQKKKRKKTMFQHIHMSKICQYHVPQMATTCTNPHGGTNTPRKFFIL